MMKINDIRIKIEDKKVAEYFEHVTKLEHAEYSGLTKEKSKQDKQGRENNRIRRQLQNQRCCCKNHY